MVNLARKTLPTTPAKGIIERFMDSEKNGGHGTAVLRSGSFGACNVPKQELGNEARKGRLHIALSI